MPQTSHSFHLLLLRTPYYSHGNILYHLAACLPLQTYFAAHYISRFYQRGHRFSPNAICAFRPLPRTFLVICCLRTKTWFTQSQLVLKLDRSSPIIPSVILFTQSIRISPYTFFTTLRNLIHFCCSCTHFFFLYTTDYHSILPNFRHCHTFKCSFTQSSKAAKNPVIHIFYYFTCEPI